MPAEVRAKHVSPWLSLTPSLETARKTAERMKKLGIVIRGSGTLTREPEDIVTSENFKNQLKAIKELRQQTR